MSHKSTRNVLGNQIFFSEMSLFQWGGRGVKYQKISLIKMSLFMVGGRGRLKKGQCPEFYSFFLEVVHIKSYQWSDINGRENNPFKDVKTDYLDTFIFCFSHFVHKNNINYISIQLNPVPIWHYNNRKIQFCVEMTKDDIKYDDFISWFTRAKYQPKVWLRVVII